MSSNLTTKLKAKFVPKQPVVVPAVPPVIIPAPKPVKPLKNGGPESDRLSKRRCELCFINGAPTIIPTDVELIPVDVEAETPPSSNTIKKRRDLTLFNATDPYNPDTRFTDFFPPAVPPPWFLQVPRYRVSNEPKARILPCVGPRQVDASYGR